MIRVVVIDDHKLVQDGYSLLFKTRDDIELVACFDNGTDFFQFIETNPKEVIDVAIIDFQMPVINGVEIIKKINDLSLDIRTILISHYTELFLVESAFLNGANGYLPKEADFDTTLAAIEQVMNVGFYIKMDLDRDYLRSLTRTKSIDPKYEFTANLTEREKEVAILVAKGFSYKEIGDSLNLSQRTIEDYKDNFCRKTKVSKQAGIAIYCMIMGWV